MTFFWVPGGTGGGSGGGGSGGGGGPGGGTGRVPVVFCVGLSPGQLPFSRQFPDAAAAGASSGSVNIKVPHSGPCASHAAQQSATVAAWTLTMPDGMTVALGHELPLCTVMLHVPGGVGGPGGGGGGGGTGPPLLLPVVFFSLRKCSSGQWPASRQLVLVGASSGSSHTKVSQPLCAVQALQHSCTLAAGTRGLPGSWVALLHEAPAVTSKPAHCVGAVLLGCEATAAATAACSQSSMLAGLLADLTAAVQSAALSHGVAALWRALTFKSVGSRWPSSSRVEFQGPQKTCTPQFILL